MATAVAIVTFAFVWVGQAPPGVPSDWDFYYLGARGIIHGINPYRAVEAAIQRGQVKLPLFYPATAPLLLAPLGALPSRLGVSLFSAGGMFFSTVLTFLVVPATYVAIERLRARLAPRPASVPHSAPAH